MLRIQDLERRVSIDLRNWEEVDEQYSMVLHTERMRPSVEEHVIAHFAERGVRLLWDTDIYVLLLPKSNVEQFTSSA